MSMILAQHIDRHVFLRLRIHAGENIPDGLSDIYQPKVDSMIVKTTLESHMILSQQKKACCFDDWFLDIPLYSPWNDSSSDDSSDDDSEVEQNEFLTVSHLLDCEGYEDNYVIAVRFRLKDSVALPLGCVSNS